jgi:hypothetical protein
MLRFALVLLVFLFPQILKAQPVDCMTPGYLDSFEVPSVGDLTCVEVFRFEVSTPGGPRIIRGIADLNADWAFRPGAASAVEQGAQLAAEALPRLGNYRIGDVTILLLDDRFTPESEVSEGPQVLAQAWDPEAATSGQSECRMTSFLWGPGGDPAEIPTTIAHEMFHCVQYASLSPEQMLGVGAGGDWWIEGSAEAFAAMAVPSADAITNARGADFDAAVSAGAALDTLSYEMAVFFYWLTGTRGWEALMPFLSGMAGAGDQHGAMREALSPEEWLDFAKAWEERTITHPQGHPALFGDAPFGESWIWDITRTERKDAGAFTLSFGWAQYACGKWASEARPGDGSLAVKEEGGPWADWPEEVDTRENPDGGLYRFLALPVEDGEIAVRGERTASCEPCRGSTEIDRCLVGQWQLTGGGPMQWMIDHGVPVSRNAMGDLFLTLFEDGTFRTDSVRVDYQLRVDTSDHVMISDALGTVFGTAGRWSVPRAGTLAACYDAGGGAAGTVTTQIDSTTVTTGFPGAPFAGDGGAPYSCGGGRFTTTIDMPRFGDMVHEFSLVAPPPEPAE